MIAIPGEATLRDCRKSLAFSTRSRPLSVYEATSPTCSTSWRKSVIPNVRARDDLIALGIPDDHIPRTLG